MKTSTGTLVHRHLTKRDGAISREGPAMIALSEKTGYSVEALRSFAYGRREPKPGNRAKLLREAVRRG